MNTKQIAPYLEKFVFFVAGMMFDVMIEQITILFGLVICFNLNLKAILNQFQVTRIYKIHQQHQP